jgi:hypothetical protein
MAFFAPGADRVALVDRSYKQHNPVGAKGARVAGSAISITSGHEALELPAAGVRAAMAVAARRRVPNPLRAMAGAGTMQYCHRQRLLYNGRRRRSPRRAWRRLRWPDRMC